MRILLVTEDYNIERKIEKTLKKDHTIDVISDLLGAVYSAEDFSYSLIIVDHAISFTSAMDLCHQIRQREVRLPILVLSDINDVSSRISSITQGADVCLPRNFDPAELSAQLKALLRRNAFDASLNNFYEIGKLKVDLWGRCVRLDDRKYPMRKREFDLLELFILNKNQVLSRERILSTLWQDSYKSDSNVVDVSICGLRNTLRLVIPYDLIKTVYGSGYIFEMPQ